MSLPQNIFLSSWSWLIPRRYDIITCLFTIVGYTSLFKEHTRHIAPNYNNHHPQTKTKLFRNAVLSFHIVAGLMEISRWYFLTIVTGQRPMAGPLEFGLCFIQSITSLILVKHLARGFPILTRPSYQSGSISRLVAAGIALYSQSPDWHESATKSVNAFVYTRLLIFYVGPLMKTSHDDIASPQAMYNFAVIVGAILSLSEGPIRNISSSYVVLVVLNAAFERWSSEKATQPVMDASEKLLVQSLLSSGFVERETINKVQPELFVAPQPGDEYVDQKDLVAHDATEDK